MRFQFGTSCLATASLALVLFSSGNPVRAQAWTAGAPTAAPVVRGTGAWFASNNRFYVLGGRSSDVAGSDYMNPLEYDPATNLWTTKAATFPSNENNNMVGGVLQDAGTPYIFVVGGSAAGAATSTPTVRRYDPVADVITVVTTDPWPAAANTLPGGGVVLNNKLYVIGGFVINSAMSTEIWQFDPAAAAGSRWTLKSAVLPVAIGYVPAATVGGQIYIGGGATWVTATLTLADSTSSYVYDPAADTIAPINAIPRATGETRAVARGGRVWVLGGGRVAPNPSNEVDSYDPAGNSWSLGPAFVTPRRNAAIDIDGAGNVYMVGGYATSAITPSGDLEILRQLATPFCFGDGSGTACPCGNSGGAGNGCASSVNANGANLASSGAPSLSNDTLGLVGTGMPSSSALYFQGTTQIGGGAGATFGDGLRCAGGSVVRLHTETNVGGASQYPQPGDPSISVKGMVTAPGSRTYQVWYRNAAAFCTPSTFNLSNGLLVVWSA
jgi:hypothetical protein